MYNEQLNKKVITQKHQQLLDKLQEFMSPSVALCAIQLAEKTKESEIVKRFLTRVQTLKKHAHSLFIKRVSFINTLYLELVWRIEKDAEEFFRLLYNNNPILLKY